VREDLRRGSVTLSLGGRAKANRRRLVRNCSTSVAQIADRMDRLPNGSSSMKDLLRMSWRSLILMAVARRA